MYISVNRLFCVSSVYKSYSNIDIIGSICNFLEVLLSVSNPVSTLIVDLMYFITTGPSLT